MKEIEHTCVNCFYQYIDSKAYPCSMCVCGEERKDLWLPKIAEQTEPSLEQFRVGLEYHTDTTHFGKAKGKSITADTTDTPQTDCLTCRYNSDEWDSPKCDSCSKAHSNYEPQTERCPFDDPIPCEWVCPNSKTDCPWK